MIKTEKQKSLIFMIALALFFLISGCNEINTEQPEKSLNSRADIVSEDLPACKCIINPSLEITPEEIEMIKFVREEEKLARDVYLTLSSYYSLPIFKNIPKSEQVHMDKVLCLLIHYNIEDPASEEIGEFTNPDLQELYNNLVDKGILSLIDALEVGATIEDLDIYDLNDDIGNTDNEAIITIFEYLVCGSGNHLRAFSGNLSFRGVEYIPQFISQELYEEILEAEHQFCGKL